MKTPITLYKYTRADGGTTVSPNKPENTEYSERIRLIADEGKLLTKDGVNLFPVIDTDSAEGWYEVDKPDVGTTKNESEVTTNEQS